MSGDLCKVCKAAPSKTKGMCVACYSKDYKSHRKKPVPIPIGKNTHIRKKCPDCGYKEMARIEIKGKRPFVICLRDDGNYKCNYIRYE